MSKSPVHELSHAAIASQIREALQPMFKQQAALADIGRQLAKRLAAAEKEAEALIECVPNIPIDEADAYLRDSPPSALAIVALTRIAADRARSDGAKRAASSKNATARKWLRDKWRDEGHEYRSRRDFVRVMHPILRRDFDTRVSEDQIYRHWFK